MILPQKHLFNLEPGVCYLNCAYMSPLLKSVSDKGCEGVRIKERPYLLSESDFFIQISEAKKLFSALIQVTPDRIALQPATSYGIATVCKNIKAVAGKTDILLLEEQFPSNVYAWQNETKRLNAHIKFVGPTENEMRGRSWNEAILNQINEQTLAISIPNVHWADGTFFDLERISKKAKENQAVLIIDGTQSIGALPFDNTKIQADAVICAAYKWLLGPYSLSFAYFGPYFDDGKPIEHNWINRKNSEDFSQLVNYQNEFKEIGSKYSTGEVSNFILLPMAIAALEQLLQWTPSGINNYCNQLSHSFFKDMQDSPFRLEEDGFRKPHLFGIHLPKGINMSVIQKIFKAENIKVSMRGNAIRISPHVYNTSEDLEKLSRTLLNLNL